jgi:hypothetical protein
MPHRPLALLLPLLCAAGVDSPDTSPHDTEPSPDSGDTGEACVEVQVGEGSPILSLEAEPTDIPTVIRVRWQTQEASTGWVTYGATADHDQRTPEQTLATSHELLLRGLRQETEVHLSVRTGSDGACWTSQDRAVTTGSFAVQLPRLELTTSAPQGSAGGYTVAPLFGSVPDLVAIIDDEGQYVWAATLVAGYRARLDQQADSLLLLRQSEGPHEQATVERVAFDGAILSETPVTGGHTDFVQVERDTFASIAWVVCADGATPVALAMAIVEAQEGGDQRVLWSDLELVPPPSACTLQQGLAWPGSPMDDTSSALNGISYDPVDDAYLVTARNWNGVISVDRATGRTNWLVRGNAEVQGGIEAPGTMITLPHSVERVDDGYLVLNQGYPSVSNARLLTLAVDPDAMTVSEVWSWTPSDVTSVDVLGNAQRLWNGSSLAVWSTAGMIDEVTPEGQVVWKLEASLNTQIGFSERVQSLYPPL